MNTAGIVQIPNPVLREVCPKVTDFGTGLRALAKELVSACWESGRVGVAAPQVGVAQHVFAVRFGRPSLGSPQIFVNARISNRSGEQRGREGCLSVRDRYFILNRSQKVTVTAQDLDGNEFTVTKTGFDAVALQHEIDHLSGTLVVDRAREQMEGLPRQQRRQVERELAKVRA